jgi:hypothetical protein
MESNTNQELIQSQDTRPEILPKVWKKKDQLNRAKDYLKDQLQKCLNDHKGREEEWQKYNKCYRLIDEQKPEEGCNVVDPEPQTIVDTLVANEMEAFFSQDPPFKFSPGEETDEDQADIMTSVVADSLRTIQIKEKFERTSRQRHIFGTCVIKTPRKREFRKIKVKHQINVNGKKKTKTVEVDMPRFDNTDWEFVSLFNFYPVGPGETIEDKQGVIEIYERTFDQLKALEQTKEDVDGNEIIKGVYSNLDEVEPAADRRLKVAEYWGLIPMQVVTGKDEDRFNMFEGVITAVVEIDKNGELIKLQDDATKTGADPNEDLAESPVEAGIRLQENPFWNQDRPYLACPYTPVDDDFYGKGVIEPIYDKWQELNTTIRQLVDNKTLLLKMPLLEETNANVQRVDKLVTNARIKCDYIDGIRPLPVADFSGPGYQVVMQLKDDMRRVSGATEAIQGTPLKDDASATEAAQSFQQAGVRIKNKIKLVDERLFKPFLFRTFQHDMQFIEYERVVKVVGKEGTRLQRVGPENIWGAFADLIVFGPMQIENNTIKTNKLINFLSIAARAPQIANIPELMKQIWVSMGFPESEAEKIVLSGSNDNTSDIQEEIQALALGQKVLVKPNQNHAEHLQLKTQAFAELLRKEIDTPESTEAFRDNIDKHAEYLEAQQKQGRVIGGQTPMNGGSNVQGLPTPNPMEEMDGGIESGTTGGQI